MSSKFSVLKNLMLISSKIRTHSKNLNSTLNFILNFLSLKNHKVKSSKFVLIGFEFISSKILNLKNLKDVEKILLFDLIPLDVKTD